MEISRPSCAVRDHPRLRGEHSHLSAVRSHTSGSSPLTRGAPVRQQRHRQRQRIIPAYAGSTPSPHRSALRRRDHPRLRGEHFEQAAMISSGKGSSPLTRGAQLSRPEIVAPVGIIPAYAGSTPASCRSLPLPRDHPRLRGEHYPQGGNVGNLSGSSPLTRGAPVNADEERVEPGIIPAYAGSTFFPATSELT